MFILIEGYMDMAVLERIGDPAARYELHPLFVWWHTLSHSLIRAISNEAGYSSASIRERVYIEVRGDGTARGG